LVQMFTKSEMDSFAAKRDIIRIESM
jgi:hypothetical protein